jgi:hypothetical protein
MASWFAVTVNAMIILFNLYIYFFYLYGCRNFPRRHLYTVSGEIVVSDSMVS